MGKELLNKLDKRKKLMTIISHKPGIHFRELHRESEMAMGELEYHLNVLEKMEVISKQSTSYYTRYYPIDELGSFDKIIMGILRKKILRDILLYLISEDTIGHRDITEHFHLAKSTTSFYINKLIEEKIVTKNKCGRQVFYEVEDPQRILRLILLYKEGFGDTIAKHVEDLWGRL